MLLEKREVTLDRYPMPLARHTQHGCSAGAASARLRRAELAVDEALEAVLAAEVRRPISPCSRATPPRLSVSA
jgi:hypothetical protein